VLRYLTRPARRAAECQRARRRFKEWTRDPPTLRRYRRSRTCVHAARDAARATRFACTSTGAARSSTAVRSFTASATAGIGGWSSAGKRRPLRLDGFDRSASQRRRMMESFSFGDSPTMANELLALVLEGRKTATAWAAVHGPLGTKVGERMIVKDGQGRPRVVIETTQLMRLRFNE
jgi:hypothetical protein